MARSGRLGMLGAARILAREFARRGTGPGWGSRVAAVPALFGRALRGRDPRVSRGRAAGYLVAVLYVISPVDLLPEALLPLVGLADDSAVLVWLLGNLVVDVDAFLAREEPPRVVVQG